MDYSMKGCPTLHQWPVVLDFNYEVLNTPAYQFSAQSGNMRR